MASVAERSGSHRPTIIFAGNIPEDPPTTDAFANDVDGEAERGRLKRRRLSSHSPPRAPSPSRGHERDSGSRHRHHYRKHHRPSSSTSSSMSPPPSVKKNRRRSDAEPDHTLRGRARNRSASRSRSPILEGDEKETQREHRKRSMPPSRHQSGEKGAVRRQRSFPNLYKEGHQKNGQDPTGQLEAVTKGNRLFDSEEGGAAPAVQEA